MQPGAEMLVLIVVGALLLGVTAFVGVLVVLHSMQLKVEGEDASVSPPHHRETDRHECPK